MLQNENKKINFNDLITDKEIKSKIIKINDIDVEVTQYLPMKQKHELVAKILQLAINSPYSFIDPIQVDMITTLEILNAYTNIDFDKISEEKTAFEIYDIVEKEAIIDTILRTIPNYEYNFIKETIEESLKFFYEYKNSILGILENANKDYSNINLDLEEIQNKINNSSEDFAFIKDVMTKMG